jgi:osmotically-inducible protein OsmY
MAVVSAKDVQSRVQEALSGSPVYALRELKVMHQGETLVLQGRVASFYHKQLAQEVVRTAAEGLEVINSIEVR